MRQIIFLSLYFLVGCATRYIIPGNRFITPESQGEFLRGQLELQQTGANQLTADLSNGSVSDGVTYTDVTRLGFLFSSSIFNKFDFVWSHTGGGNSLFGVKLQLLGDSKVSKGTGHKVAFAALGGANDHETGDTAVKFRLSGKEYVSLYGYRITENFLPYISFSYGTYNFSGEVSSSNPAINGLKPSYETKVRSLNSGIELTYEAISSKLEASYQQLNTGDTKQRTHFVYGYSIGYNW